MWEEFFPLNECRPPQAEALNFIFASLEEADDLFLELPTGVGKSAIAETVGLYFEAHSKRTYISTTTVDLEDQYVADFYDFGLRQLHSSVHYQCPHWTNCDIGSCTITEKSDEEDLSQSDTPPVEQEEQVLIRRRCSRSNCPYEIAKEEFENAAVAIANSAYLITKARFVKDFPARSLAIIDEAHRFHDQITASYAFVIPQSEISKLPNPVFPGEGDEILWLREVYWPFLTHQCEAAKARFSLLGPRHPEIERARAKVRSLLSKKANLKIVLSADPEEWIFDVTPGGTVLYPSSLGITPRSGPDTALGRQADLHVGNAAGFRPPGAVARD
jgi:Rad3-related DNA helicase